MATIAAAWPTPTARPRGGPRAAAAVPGRLALAPHPHQLDVTTTPRPLGRGTFRLAPAARPRGGVPAPRAISDARAPEDLAAPPAGAPAPAPPTPVPFIGNLLQLGRVGRHFAAGALTVPSHICHSFPV